MNENLNSSSLRIEIKNLKKSYFKEPAINNLSLKLNFGRNYLLLGANGSGKSTLLKILSGILSKDSGEINFYRNDKIQLISPLDCGFLGSFSMLYPAMKVSENLEFLSKIKGVEANLEETISDWELTKISSSDISSLSKGEQMRVSLAATFIHKPKILFLDEVSSPLDEKSLKLLKNAIKKTFDTYKEEALSLFATHDLQRMADLADSAIILQQGKVLALEESQTNISLSQIITRYIEVNR